ncbi:AMP-dependent synthetase and ligase [Microbacterium sp. C448]|uniref:AMP-binding protein n=1 Tax=Microbacterium TaxID=33882 RepID=UPI0003DE05D4|nr:MULTISPECIES: AMP-binding protein [Microbacterium]CDK01158.1 AMP-dependent synthetase and ligase [Microbacterium sp. C448]
MATAMKGYYSDVWQALGRAMPDRTAIVAPDERISYRRFTDAAGSLARHLTERGLGPGDGLGILLYNRPEYLVAFYAGFATGIAPTPINYRFRPAEVAGLLNDSSAGALLYPASLADVVAEAVLLCAIRPALIEIDDVGAGTGPVLAGATSYVDVIATPGRLPETPPPGGELRLYTGGTTGRPKAVLWGAEDILDVQLYSIYDSVGVRPPTDMTQAVGIALSPETPRVVSLPLAPFMHGTALFTSINTLILGGTVVVTSSPRLDADDAVRLSIEEGVTRLIVAGDAIALPLAAAAEQAGITRLGRVSSAISSGMRFGDVAKRRLHDLGLTSIIDLLASTEGGPFAVNVTTSVEDVPGTFRLMPGAVVLDEQQEEVQHTVGARGILAFRGTLPRGYLGDEEKTRATFPELRGVRHVVPGDWVRVLPEGAVELLGRGSAVVNTGGEKVYPVEVEEALLTHASVADAVVFGMPDARFGEVVTAVVVPAPGATVDTEQLRDHVGARLAGYKKPRNVFVRESLERTPHGKVDMLRLKESVAAELTVD